MKRLKKEIEILTLYISIKDISNQKISKASAYWHAQHTLLTIETIYQSLQTSNSSLYKPSFKISKFFVLITGIIPRGKAESPQNVRPKEYYSYEKIKEEIEKIKTLLPLLERLPTSSYFDHPFLGNLTKSETIKFLIIHTHHHIKIIKDIVRQ